MKKFLQLLSVSLLMLLLCAGKATSQGFSFSSPNLPEWATTDKSSVLTEIRQNFPIWLVRVRAVEVKSDPHYDGKFNLVTLKIVHIYSGPEKIKDTTFEVSTIPDSHGIKVLNLKLNDLAIYCVIPYADMRVRRGKREGQVAPTIPTKPIPTSLVSELASLTGSCYGYDFPMQQSNPLFTQALAYAQSIERVAKAPRDEQLRLLRAYAKSPLPQRSAWAIATLAQNSSRRELSRQQNDSEQVIDGSIPQPKGSSLIEETNQGLWLVKAKCLSVTADFEKLAQWQIEHVYNGPTTLMNKVFSLNHAPTISSSFVTTIEAPDKGDEALWIVRLTGEKVTPDPGLIYSTNEFQLAYNLALPLIQNHPLPKGIASPLYSDFNRALPYAQSIERVVKAERNEQIRLLGAYAKSALPQRSAWAIATLAQSGIEAAPKFLLDLVNDPKIPIAGQLALDKGLDALDKAGQMQWSASSTRLDLWRRLVTSPADENDALDIVNGIANIALNESRKRQGAQMSKTQYTPAIAGTQLFEWLRLAATNAKWTTQVRARAVNAVGEIAKLELIERDVAFAYLLARVQALPELALGAKPRTATQDEIYQAQGPFSGLQYLLPLSDAEAAPLRELQRRAQSRYVKDALEQLLAPAK